MQRLDIKSELVTYDTAINVIGGLKDISAIFKAINSHFNKNDSIEALIHERNELNLRTEKSRKRIEYEIKKSYVKFINEDHEELIQSIFLGHLPQQDKDLVLFWQFALNNRLFREITSVVFMKAYYSGRISISKDDIVAFLKEFLRKNGHLNLSWSEITIDTLSSKYLNLMSKFGLLSAGRKKIFKHVRPTIEAQVIFFYFAKLFSPDRSNILSNDLLPISFIPLEDMHERLKKLSLKGFLNMGFTGENLNIELIHSYKGICNVLYN